MTTYLLKRFALAIPTLIGVSILVFAMVRMLPGDAVDQIFGENASIASDKATIRRELGLDKPVYQQYGIWAWGVLRGNLGTSLQSQQPVRTELANRLPPTVELGAIAILTGLVVGLSIGVLSAVKRNSLFDFGGRSFAITLLAVPSFWIGTLAIVLPARFWHWAPPFLYKDLWDDPLSNLQQVGIAAVLLGVHSAGTLMRFSRTALLETLGQDYIRTARSKGLSPRLVYVRHALRNALIPVITIVGLQVPLLVGGTVIMEQIFGIPGVGQYFLTALEKRDYPVIQAVNLLVAVVVVLSNIVVDITYTIIDPRTGASA